MYIKHCPISHVFTEEPPILTQLSKRPPSFYIRNMKLELTNYHALVNNSEEKRLPYLNLVKQIVKL